MMLLQNDETPYSKLNTNMHHLTKIFTIVGDLGMGIRGFMQIAFIFIIILHFFDIYVIKDFTLVDPYFTSAAICTYLLIYFCNITIQFTSGWFAEGIGKILYNPQAIERPHQSRDDVSEIEREHDRQREMAGGIGRVTMERPIQYFEIGNFANATVMKSLM